MSWSRVFVCTVGLCSLHVYLVFSLCIVVCPSLFNCLDMILRVDVRSATDQENTSHAVTRPRMAAELVVAFTDPRGFLYFGAAAPLLLDGGMCSVIEHQQDQLMYQQMVIDEAGAARTPVPPHAHEYGAKPVDLRIGNDPETLFG